MRTCISLRICDIYNATRPILLKIIDAINNILYASLNFSFPPFAKEDCVFSFTYVHTCDWLFVPLL